jgi:ABC-type histidine transport system ATPase subunit
MDTINITYTPDASIINVPTSALRPEEVRELLRMFKTEALAQAVNFDESLMDVAKEIHSTSYSYLPEHVRYAIEVSSEHDTSLQSA